MILQLEATEFFVGIFPIRGIMLWEIIGMVWINRFENLKRCLI